jgi:hypothetical protein
LQPGEEIGFAAAAGDGSSSRYAPRRSRRLDHRQQLDAAVDIVDHHLVAFALAVERAPVPRAVIRWKCSETPSGAMAIISVSTVGFPGGTRNPSLALQPIIAWCSCLVLVGEC